jgi:hypothetical protein
MARRPSPSDVSASDVSDEEWAFVAPYLSLLPQTAAQRRHVAREVFNVVRSHGPSGRTLAAAAGPLSAVGGGLSADAPLDRRQQPSAASVESRR